MPSRLTAVTSSSRRVMRSACGQLSLRLRHVRQAVSTRFYSTYTQRTQPQALARFMPAAKLHDPSPGQQTAIDAYLQHRFDLLGSGWMAVRHGITCNGLGGVRYERGPTVAADTDGRWLKQRLNRASVAEARQRWKLVDKGYTPIDWQLDFKSGYRWSEKTWCHRISPNPRPAADAGVPRHLGRMLHLPQLALAYGQSRDGRLAAEFRNQTLDFMATNPPWWGVNWSSTMDVAIRAANWACAYDLFCAHGHTFDEAFTHAFKRSLSEHGRFIVANLERHGNVRGHHYLADIVGLLWIAAYLPQNPETDHWLHLACRELLHEIPLRFYADGGYAEGSTPCHRFAAEMAIWGVSLLLALPANREPPVKPDTVVLERLYNMARFTMAITRPHGAIAQVGDNNGSRFFALQQVYDMLTTALARQRYGNLPKSGRETSASARYPDVRHLDHRGLVAAIGTLFDDRHMADFSGENWVEHDIIRHLCPVPCPAPALTIKATCGQADAFDSLKNTILGLPAHQRQTLKLDLPQTAQGAWLNIDLATQCFDDFGVYTFMNPRLWMMVRCGAAGAHGRTYSHMDQLSLNLCIDGRDLVADPGTALYPLVPHDPQSYRQPSAHFTPQVKGFTEMLNIYSGTCLYAGPKGFAGQYEGPAGPVYRVVELADKHITVYDGAENAPLQPLSWPWACPVPYAPGYGQWARG